MPTYEYFCRSCGRFEHFQRITAEPLRECPTCGEPVQRLISKNGGVIFKGSGFYTTDSRSSKNGKSDSTSDAKGNSETVDKSA